MNTEITIRGDTYKIIKNNSKVYYNGSKWCSNNSGEFIIIERVLSKNKSKYIFVCKFCNTNTLEVASMSNIKCGKLEDKMNKSISNIGMLGYGDWKSSVNGKHTKEYAVWKDIILRCYSPNNPNYKFYGAKGVYVSEDFLNFQKFCNSISKLDNYNKWKNDKNNIWNLDKDILCDKLNIHPKVYSLKTCQFILKSKNVSFSAIKNCIYIAENINTKERKEFNNQTKFAKENGLNPKRISDCINEKQLRHGDFIFKIKKEA